MDFLIKRRAPAVSAQTLTAWSCLSWSVDQTRDAGQFASWGM